jgi:hypothetical protein
VTNLSNKMLLSSCCIRYKELVFYLEACESGSMFEDFPTGMNMYITTAANGKESSWGTYCAPNDMVNGMCVLYVVVVTTTGAYSCCSRIHSFSTLFLRTLSPHSFLHTCPNRHHVKHLFG